MENFQHVIVEVFAEMKGNVEKHVIRCKELTESPETATPVPDRGICREGEDKHNCQFRIMYIM
jgi:hypothetical protein